MYARNVQTLLLLLKQDPAEGEEGAKVALDLEDEIIDGALLTHEGVVRHDRTLQALEGGQS